MHITARELKNGNRVKLYPESDEFFEVQNIDSYDCPPAGRKLTVFEADGQWMVLWSDEQVEIEEAPRCDD